MLLTLSNFVIALNKSYYYLKTLGLLYLFAAITIFNTSLPLIMQIFIATFTCVLAIYFYKIYAKTNPFPILIFYPQQVLLIINGNEYIYEKTHIEFDCVLFLIIKFLGKKNKKLLIFKDQIDNNNYRLLKLRNLIDAKK